MGRSADQGLKARRRGQLFRSPHCSPDQHAARARATNIHKVDPPKNRSYPTAVHTRIEQSRLKGLPLRNPRVARVGRLRLRLRLRLHLFHPAARMPCISDPGLFPRGKTEG
jgi:hypothetical protein